MTGDAPQRPHLSSRGQIHVTTAAAERYATHMRCGVEQGRRELLELLRDAVLVEAIEGVPEQWRYRRRSTGVDITARVVPDGPIMSVVAISIRDHRAGGSGGRQRR